MYAYPRAQILPYPARVLFDGGPLSRCDSSSDRAKAGRTGGPRNGRCLVVTVERWEALRLALGARGCLAPRGGYVIPASRVPIGALAPPTAPSPSRGFREDLANLG